jgi:ABC-type long-subunit fatty acid transport system fused permease/ATPase subunit
VETAWRFAEWIGNFGDVITKTSKYGDLDQFIHQFVAEGVMIAVLFIVIQAWINLISKKFCIYWDEAIFFHELPNWNKTLQDVEGSSQRLQDSVDIFTQKFLIISKPLVRSALVLWKFMPKLWDLSSNFHFLYFTDVPGMLVWIAILIGVFGIIISFFVGIHLTECKYNLQDAKALFRSGLEFIQRNKKRDDSIPHMEKLWKNVKKTNFRLFNNQFFLDLWMGAYGQFWSIAPVAFFGYNVFSGYVKYGLVTKTGSALGEVVGAISAPIWLWDDFMEYRSVVQRLRELEETINNPDNWEEAKKEEGWEDRRLGGNIANSDEKKQ